MAELAVEMTYAQALYELGTETNKAKEILEDAKSFEKILEENEELFIFLKSPAISMEAKKDLLENLLRGKSDDNFLNFILILLEKRRFNMLDRIIRAYERMYEKKDGVVEGVILSVEPLKEEKIEKFSHEVGKLLGQRVELKNSIDKGLIAGVKIFVDGRVIDASVKSRIDKLAAKINI